MANQASFWTRVGSFFRSDVPSNGRGDQSLTNSAVASEVVPLGSVDGSRSQSESASHSGRLSRSILHWGRRDPLARRDGSERVSLLIDAMTEHFDKQDQRAEQLAQAVNRMAGILEQLPDVQRGHSDSMGHIASHLEMANRHACELRETLARVPSSIQAQAEAIRSVSKQLEASAASEAQVIESLHQLGQVTGTLGQAGTAQVDALQRIHAENSDQRAALTALVHQQGQRFLITMIVAGILVMGALGTMAVTLWMTLGRG